MSTVVVYKFRKYDITRDEYVVSRRMATVEAIQRLGDGFFKIDGTEQEVDDGELDPTMDGMTRLPPAEFSLGIIPLTQV